MNRLPHTISLVVGALLLPVLAGASSDPQVPKADAPAAKDEVKDWKPPGVRIGYVLWHEISCGVRETPDHKEECPKGFNIGPREQFAEEFPKDGKKRTLAETQ